MNYSILISNPWFLGVGPLELLPILFVPVRLRIPLSSLNISSLSSLHIASLSFLQHPASTWTRWAVRRGSAAGAKARSGGTREESGTGRLSHNGEARRHARGRMLAAASTGRDTVGQCSPGWGEAAVRHAQGRILAAMPRHDGTHMWLHVRCGLVEPLLCGWLRSRARAAVTGGDGFTYLILWKSPFPALELLLKYEFSPRTQKPDMCGPLTIKAEHL